MSKKSPAAEEAPPSIEVERKATVRLSLAEIQIALRVAAAEKAKDELGALDPIVKRFDVGEVAFDIVNDWSDLGELRGATVTAIAKEPS